MYGLNKYMIDINIETLAGTTFSLKVSPLESIQSVKAKIQRHEGIPISHQHLVWQSNELEDKCSLNDYNIPNGATIRMVLALRGGPINTRRMTTEDTLIRDVSDLMEIHEDSNLWNTNDSSNSTNKHVTLLLFRDGDHLNLLRVIDRGDAPSPISGAMSAASMYVPYDETDHDAGGVNNLEEGITDLHKSKKSNKLNSKRKKSANNENQKTKEKMLAIKNRMNQLKKEHESATTTSNNNNTTNNFNNNKEDSLNKSDKNIENDSKNSDNGKLINENQNSSNVKTKKSSLNNRPPSNVNTVKAKRFNVNSSTTNHSHDQIHPTYIDINNKDNNNNKDVNTNEPSQNLENKQQQINDAQLKDVNNSKYVYYEEYNGEDGEYEEEVDDEDISDEDECYDEEYLEDDEYDEEDDDEEENEDDDYDEDEDDDEAAQEDEDDEQDENVSKFNQEQYYANLSQSCENVNNIETEYETGDRQIAGEDEENYDEDENENELLLNKSEFLINEDHQTTNSPSSGLAGADLMAIMMMTVNSDQFSLNGVPSSLATTALPTVITPFYNTDNENFVIPYSGSARNNKNKYLRGISKKNYDGTLSSKIEYVKNRKKAASKVPKTENEDLEENDDSKLEQKNKSENQLKTRVKQRRRKRQPKEQNVSTQSYENGETSMIDKDQEKITDNKISGGENNNRRSRKRYEVTRAEVHQITSFSPTTILVKTVSIDNNNNNNNNNNSSTNITSNKKKKDSIQKKLKQILNEEIELGKNNSDLTKENTSEKIENFNASALTRTEPTEVINNNHNNNINHSKIENESTFSQHNNINKIETISESPANSTEITNKINENLNLKNSKNESNEIVDSNVNSMGSSLRKSSALASGNNPRIVSSSQKRVSFTVNLNEEQKYNENDRPALISNSSEISLTKSVSNAGITKPIIKSKSPVSFATSNNLSNSLLEDSIFQNKGDMVKNSQQLKPFLLSNYKQKPPPKLDSLYTHQDANNSSINHSIQLYRQNTNLRSDLENRNILDKPIDTIGESLPKNHLNPIISGESANYAKLQQSLLSKRNPSENYTNPIINSSNVSTTSSTLNKLDVLKNNLGSASILKPYQHPIINNYTTNTNKLNLDNEKNTHSIEISRIYSGSHSKINNKPFSISANDLSQTKTLKLPPVVTNNQISSDSTILIAGSTNNINSIGLNDALTKKKVNDLSRYCYFCKKKTGLASSYICRCGNNYCTQHRNAEAHNCTYDYKTEGRKLIEHSNPLVAAPKLPKI